MFTVLSDTIVAESYDIDMENSTNLCYVSYGTSGIMCYNVTDYSNPQHIATVPEQNGGYAHQLLKVGNNIYIGDGRAGLTVINWTTSDSPHVQNRTLGYYGWASNVDEAHETLFLASGAEAVGYECELVIFNISQSGQLDLFTEFALPITPVDVEYVENKVFLTGEFIPLLCIDVSNVSNPIELGRAEENPQDCYGTDIEIVGEYAYVANWQGNFQVFSIQDPTNISLIAEIEEYSYGTGVEFDENLMYLVDERDGLIVFDVSNPENLIEVAQFTSTRVFYMVEVHEEYVFLTHHQGFMILQRVRKTIPGYNPMIISAVCLGISCVIGFYMRKKGLN